MKKIERKALLPYSAHQMFGLVNDIEAYPEFMAGCKRAKVLERTEHTVTARLELQQSGITQAFTTRNELIPDRAMTLQLVDGPFKHFEGQWLFEPVDDNACEMTFRLSFQFANPVLGLAANKLMQSLAGEQVDAICARAKAVYGS